MRDPDGVLEQGGGRLLRRLRCPMGPDHFLRSSTAQRLVELGMLVPFRIVDSSTIECERVRFVTYPHEWTNEQLMAAAQLTLDICQAIEKDGLELKDASAWNVLFLGAQPIFCDHLSFVPRLRHHWLAFSQFTCHFILPLAVSPVRGIQAYKFFCVSREGVSPDIARALLGWRRFGMRHWLLTLNLNRSNLQITQVAKKPHHENLYNVCRWFLRGTSSREVNTPAWVSYANSRPHYSEAAGRYKRQVVESWLSELRPSWVTDFGCNTGEYTRMALGCGASVVAIDADAACIEQLRASCMGNPNLFTVICDLQDMTSASGWIGGEFPTLAERLQSIQSVALMLAVTHHLAVSSSIPYAAIFRFLRQASSGFAIVEVIGERDPMLQQLAEQRNRRPGDFSEPTQRAAIESFFKVVAEASIPGMDRQLLLLETK